MRFRSFEWDEHNIEHIARHAVTPEEAEEACDNAPLVKKGTKPYYLVLGQTDAGRHLALVVIQKFTSTRVATARDMDHSERKRYARK